MDRMAYCHDYPSLLHSSKTVAHCGFPGPRQNAVRLPGHYGMTGAGRTVEDLIKVKPCCFFITLFAQN